MSNINVDTLEKWLKEDSVTLVDVRRVDEFAREHIAEAVNIPLEIVGNETLAQIPTHKIVMQCNTGGRSSRCCAAVKKIDTSHDVYSLEGGIEAWKAAGKKTVKTQNAIAFPLYRQVQTGAGSLVALGVVLGYLVNPAFYGLSLLVGLGLFGAGITGWCGMAAVLQRAPWNNFSK